MKIYKVSNKIEICYNIVGDVMKDGKLYIGQVEGTLYSRSYKLG
jgi:hypothetical protein